MLLVSLITKQTKALPSIRRSRLETHQKRMTAKLAAETRQKNMDCVPTSDQFEAFLWIFAKFKFLS
jgi:hypothetical protein